MDDMSQYLGLYVQTANEYIQKLNSSLLILEKDASNVEAIEEIFRSAHSLKSQSAAMSYSSTGFLCHTIEDIFFEIKKGRFKLDSTLASLLFSAFDALKSSVLNVEKFQKELNLQNNIDELKKLTGVKTEGAGKSERSSNEIEKVGQSAQQDVEKNDKQQSHSTQNFTSEIVEKTEIKMIPVSVNVLDDILNELEELLVHRSELKQLILKDGSTDLRNYYEATQKILDNLQFQVMHARTVPLNMIFDTYPRTVRDVATQEKKEVQLEMSGGDLSLDRKIVEKLNEPLIHMLRNAVSHGIEKSGKINLTAKRETDHIVIEMADDGRGIDWDKIALKANVTEKDPKKLEKYLFSGISTSDSVSQVSGRGIGLTAVKKMLNDFGGYVNVRNNEPHGTVFSMTLPLSLSIVKSMLVSVGKRMFGIPILSVHRSIFLNTKDLKQTAGNEAILFEDGEVPLIRLSDRFGDYNKKEEVESGDTQLSVVIVKISHGLLGLVVDRIVETADLIVRPLPELLQKSYIGGATILANGETALMINSLGLI